MQCGHWQSFPDVQIYLPTIEKSDLQKVGKSEKTRRCCSGPAVPGDEDRSFYSWPVVGGNRKGEGQSEGNFVSKGGNCVIVRSLESFQLDSV